MWFLSCLLSLLSCSHDNDFLEDYMQEIDPEDTIWQRGVINDTLICSYEKYMSIPVTYGIGQGAACYDKYLIQGYSNNAALGIYDLEKKISLGKIDITDPVPNSSIHANTVNFGNQHYDKNDFFPLLYVSSGYTSGKNKNSFIYVYRILRDTDSDGTEVFSASLVQTITLKGFETWTEGILDNEHNLIWVKYVPNGADGPFRYASFSQPKCN